MREMQILLCVVEVQLLLREGGAAPAVCGKCSSCYMREMQILLCVVEVQLLLREGGAAPAT